MQPETVFSVCNTLALLGWILLLAGFQKTWSVRAARWMAIGFTVMYSIVIGLHFGTAEGGFNTLADVMKLFDNRWVTVGGWVHYLAFDMFIGAWIVFERRKDELARWRLVPALPLTFMFGPAGLLCSTALQGKGI